MTDDKGQTDDILWQEHCSRLMDYREMDLYDVFVSLSIQSTLTSHCSSHSTTTTLSRRWKRKRWCVPHWRASLLSPIMKTNVPVVKYLAWAAGPTRLIGPRNNLYSIDRQTDYNCRPTESAKWPENAETLFLDHFVLLSKYVLYFVVGDFSKSANYWFDVACDTGFSDKPSEMY